MKEKEDAFGRSLMDHYQGKDVYGVVERDDGYIDVTGLLDVYFYEHEYWPEAHKKAIEQAGNRVLDIGCGAGKHSLYLQRKGHEVTAIDISPGAVEVCEKRGVKDARVLDIDDIDPDVGPFDTILMLGNNFGLLKGPKKAREYLETFHDITPPDGNIIAESNDIYQTDNPIHEEYQEFNRGRGRMSGQLRLRNRYKKYATPWFDYLMVSKQEMKDIIEGTSWCIDRFIDRDGPFYIGVLEKDDPIDTT